MGCTWDLTKDRNALMHPFSNGLEAANSCEASQLELGLIAVYPI